MLIFVFGAICGNRWLKSGSPKVGALRNEVKLKSGSPKVGALRNEVKLKDIPPTWYLIATALQ